MKEVDLLNMVVKPDATFKMALKKLDESSARVIFVVGTDSVLLGALSDGDVRRALLAGLGLNESISENYNRKPLFLEEGNYSDDDCREIFLRSKVLVLPVLDLQGRIKDAVSWDEVFGDNTEKPVSPKQKIDIPVVIMAGGKGTRLAPFTNILPKPLIPVGEKTILELIVESFRENGVQQFYFTLNYRGEMIKAYFDSLKKDYSVEYVWEKEFLGTAGCLKTMEDRVPQTFLVSNCDIVVRADFSDVLKFHKSSGASLTVVSSIQHIVVPYGVIEFEGGGVVKNLIEKPEYSYSINTGVYILEAHCLQLIPENEFFHMTHLIEALMAQNHKVCTYPVNEKDYLDIGQWEEYRKSIAQLG